MFIRYIAVFTAGVAFVLLIWLRSQQPLDVIALNPAVEQTVPNRPSPDSAQVGHTAEPAQDSPETELEAQAALQWVTDDYAEMIQFPEQSRPIADAEAVQKYLPNLSTPITRELSSGALVLTTDRLRFLPDEPISGTVAIPDQLADPRLSLTLIQEGAELARLPSIQGGGAHAFSFPAQGQSWQNDPLFVVAVLNATGQDTVTVSTPVLPDNRSGDFVVLSADDSYVDGSWLMIPLRLSVEVAGFYRLEGNLYSVATGEPLLHLMNDAELQSGRGEMHLKAHIRALAAKGDMGDYRLADLILERMPGPPDFEVTYGQVPEHPIVVQGFPFSRYDDKAYVDSEAIARLEFLRSLSQ